MSQSTLEAAIRANLAHETNGKGRRITEYRLRVEELADELLNVRVHPEGFPTEEISFGIAGNLLTTKEELATDIVARSEEALEERKRVDREHAERIEAQVKAENDRIEQERQEHNDKVAAARRATSSLGQP